MATSESPCVVDNKMQSDVIGTCIGNWGRWQLRTVLIIFLCKIPAAWFMAVLIFTAPIPREGEFHCSDASGAVAAGPETAGANQNASELINFNYESPRVPVSSDDACYTYQNHPDSESMDEDDGIIDFKNASYWSYSEGVRVPCENFIHTGKIRSIITDFDLVCSRTILVAVTQTFHLMGVLIGGIIANQMLYSISPRRVMIIGMVTQIICGNITGFVPTYWLHAAFR